MFHSPVLESRFRSWLYVGLWTLCIYLTIPIARAIQTLVVEHLDRSLFSWFVVLWVILCLVLVVCLLVRHGRSVGAVQYVWLALVAGAYLGGTWHLRTNPEEALHFVQYGMLGLLVYRALTHYVRDAAIYFSAAMICGMLGVLDEIIQWVTPRRFWDFRDVLLNFIGASLMQTAIALGIRPKLIRPGWPSAASLRLSTRLTASLLILLGLCASSTPQRWERLAEHFPALEYLANNHSMMADYGHRHMDPEIGVFVSYLSLRELRREDETRGREYAEILQKYRDPSRYKEFLDKYPAFAHPFVHEARVRLFRRDRYLKNARKHEPGSAAHVQQVAVAQREDLILRRYFVHTYHAASLDPDDESAEVMKRWHDPDASYVSPVGGQLFTRVREGQLWLIVVACVILLETAQKTYGRRWRTSCESAPPDLGGRE